METVLGKLRVHPAQPDVPAGGRGSGSVQQDHRVGPDCQQGTRRSRRRPHRLLQSPQQIARTRGERTALHDRCVEQGQGGTVCLDTICQYVINLYPQYDPSVNCTAVVAVKPVITYCSLCKALKGFGWPCETLCSDSSRYFPFCFVFSLLHFAFPWQTVFGNRLDSIVEKHKSYPFHHPINGTYWNWIKEILSSRSTITLFLRVSRPAPLWLPGRWGCTTEWGQLADPLQNYAELPVRAWDEPARRNPGGLLRSPAEPHRTRRHCKKKQTNMISSKRLEQNCWHNFLVIVVFLACTPLDVSWINVFIVLTGLQRDQSDDCPESKWPASYLSPCKIGESQHSEERSGFVGKPDQNPQLDLFYRYEEKKQVACLLWT